MRLNIKISDELGQKLEKWSNSFGMSKSAFVAYALGNHIRDLEFKSDIVGTLNDKIKETDFGAAQLPESELHDENLYQ